MTTSDVHTTPAFNVDWKAAVWASLVAGAVFMMVEMAMVALTGGSPWGPPRMMAAIVLGKGVLPPPATFDLMIMMAAMAVHLMLSVLLGFVAAFGFARWRPGLSVGTLVGAVFGLVLYVVNFYGFTALFPWFAMARNLISITGHAIFGVVLAGTYLNAYASDLWLETPDGKRKLLLSLPRYDFNWQRSYVFAEPIKIPAGSRLIANYVYDNSKRNPANPDPNRKITWGEQSWEEMLFTSVSFRWLDETAAKQVDSDARFSKTRMLGMMDDNIDGKLQQTELRGQVGNMLKMAWARLDTNKDGALDKAELAVAQSFMGNRRRGSEATQDGPNANTPLGF